MKKVKVYRVIGWILVGYGIIGYLANLATQDKFQGFINDPAKELMPALYGSLMAFAINIFLWVGLILHWRADRNESPDKKSKWGRFIKPYLIFTIVMFIWTAYLIIVPNLLRRS